MCSGCACAGEGSAGQQEFLAQTASILFYYLAEARGAFNREQMILGPLHAATLQLGLKMLSPMPDVPVTCFNFHVTKSWALAGLQHSSWFAWLKIKSICAFAYQSWARIPPASPFTPCADRFSLYLFPDKKVLVTEMLKITNVSSCLE